MHDQPQGFGEQAAAITPYKDVVHPGASDRLAWTQQRSDMARFGNVSSAGLLKVALGGRQSRVARVGRQLASMAVLLKVKCPPNGLSVLVRDHLYKDKRRAEAFGLCATLGSRCDRRPSQSRLTQFALLSHRSHCPALPLRHTAITGTHAGETERACVVEHCGVVSMRALGSSW